LSVFSRPRPISTPPSSPTRRSSDLIHSDVGGYTSINAVLKDYVRSPELLARWAEMSAFGVVMRTHEGNRPGENLQVYSDSETRADRKSTRLNSSHVSISYAVFCLTK